MTPLDLLFPLACPTSCSLGTPELRLPQLLPMLLLPQLHPSSSSPDGEILVLLLPGVSNGTEDGSASGSQCEGKEGKGVGARGLHGKGGGSVRACGSWEVVMVMVRRRDSVKMTNPVLRMVSEIASIRNRWILFLSRFGYF